MNITKLLTLFLTGIMTTGIILLVIQLLVRKIKQKSESDLLVKPAYSIWYAGMFLSASLVVFKILVFSGEATDNTLKIAHTGLLLDLSKTVSLFIGIGTAWYLLTYFFAKLFAILLLGLRNEEEEMALGNTHYFLIRAATLIGLAFCLSPILDLIFRMVMPNVQLPFYH
jgi:hypothetical protein